MIQPCPIANDSRQRAHYLPITNYHALNMACRLLIDSFDWGVYLVGSCMERRDYRDVDVRCMLPDDAFDRMFPEHAEAKAAGRISAKHLAMNLAFSAYLKQQSDLPVDFQFQRTSDANQEFKGIRSALGFPSWHRSAA